MICSYARSTRNGAYECTIGRSPVSASPPATPTISCSRMPTLSTRSGWRRAAGANGVGRDVGQHERGARVLVEQRGGRGDERVPHRSASLRFDGGDDDVRPAGAVPAVSAAFDRRRGRGRPRWRRPAVTVNRAAMPPGQPWVADWLSITIAVRRSRPVAPAYAMASWLEPSSSSASPSSTYDPGRGRPWARRPSAMPTARPQPVAERAGADLDAGHQQPVGVVAERAVRRRRGRRATRRGRSPWRPAPRSRRPARGPWRAGTGPGPGRRRSSGVTRRTRS